MNTNDKAERYRQLVQQIAALVEGETDMTAIMSNVAAAIHTEMGFWWTGFYRVVTDGVEAPEGELLLGPFQGPVACMHIGYGKGVCGTAWQRGETIVVPDVEQFPGHIACSSTSRSEIVVPIYNKKVRRLIAMHQIDRERLAELVETDVPTLDDI